MKDKILYLIVGFLLGAVVAASICYFHEKSIIEKYENGSNSTFDFMNGEKPEGLPDDMPTPPDGEMPDFSEDGERPEPPEDGERPELPDKENDKDKTNDKSENEETVENNAQNEA